MARRRFLPFPAAAALDIIVAGGSREIRTNDLTLQMYHRGFDRRATTEALRAFERRGWLTSVGSLIVISEEAYASKPPAAQAKAARPGRKHARVPRGLFAR